MLHGVAARFYRGIGAETQYIGTFSRINVFIGANNSGKSIVLNLIWRYMSGGIMSAPQSLLPEEKYLGQQTGEFSYALGEASECVKKKFTEEIRSKHRNVHQADEFIKLISEIIDNLSCDKMIFIENFGDKYRYNCKIMSKFLFDEMQYWLSEREWMRLWSALTEQQGGGLLRNWVPETLECIVKRVTKELPKIHLIPAKRQLGESGHEFNDLSGRGLIDHLAALQNPSFDRQSDRNKFSKINLFLKEVLEKKDARLEVPYKREHLLVHMDNKVLPLASFGTGIHEVILIASFCTIHDESIICIEEPEIHLHPLLQRKLMAYISKNTNSQYFIATHSPSFIDFSDASIFHVRNDGVQTYVKKILDKESGRGVLDDLGIQASDILQANAVIWVEGPSDRLYVNHWISTVDTQFKEGIHYSIMFFGGALIAHLSASDEAMENFIKLRDINRHMAILIDSDRDSGGAELKPHVQRLKEEISGSSAMCWVTEGREVENYIEADKIQDALRGIHPRIYGGPVGTGQYDHSFYFYRNDPQDPEESKIYKGGDKVAVARWICEQPANLDILDLRSRVNDLVSFIKQANGIKS